MSADTLRTVFTYLIALVVIVGGGALLIIPTQLEADTLLPFLTGAIGTTLGYVFGERATASATSNQPTTTYTAGPPATFQVAPPEPREPYPDDQHDLR
jgi:hypothetical protein